MSMRAAAPLGLLLVAVSGLIPASAYHVDGLPVAGSPFPGANALTAADWVLETPGIVCESEYGAGFLDPATGLIVAADDRNPSLAGLPGVGGLCTTGQNDATGSTPFPSVAGALAGVPRLGMPYIRLDVCSATTVARNGLAFGPYPGGGAACAPVGATDQHGFTVEVGAFSCFVPTNARPGVLDPAADWAVYYDPLYLWFFFDGTPPFTPGDPIGAPHSGTQGTASNSEDASHGHAAVFVSMADSKPLASLRGSVETVPIMPPPPLTNTAGLLTTPSNSCGGSPACGPGVFLCPAPFGPVVRAANAANPVVPAPAVCAQTWDNAGLMTYPCPAVPCGPLAPPQWTVEVVGHSVDPLDAGATVTAGLACTGGALPATATLAAAGPAQAGRGTASGSVAGGGPACARPAGPAGGTLPNDMDTAWAVVCRVG